MSQDGSLAPPPASASLATRTLVRKALKATLATLDRTSGHPYASLVTIATNPAGAPLLLISKLALHTQNLMADQRASLLCDGTGLEGDPLANGRVTLIGHVRPTTDTTARRRFLARHPEAEMYASFADFAFYELELERAHYIGGFGRIVDLSPQDLLLDTSAAHDLIEAEPDIVAHMNADHTETLELYATAICSAARGPWRMTGIDPEGFDIVRDGACHRVLFLDPVFSANQSRTAFKGLADLARNKMTGS